MSPSTLRIASDPRTRFPLVMLPDFPFQVGWAPLTWVQLEYFLAETYDRRFDAAWYQNLVKLTRRAPLTKALRASDLPNLFVRGLTLQETEILGNWWGGDRFRVPTADQWQQLQQAALRLPSVSLQAFEIQPPMSPRALRVLQALDETAKTSQAGRSLADQMLLQGGIHELVMREAGHVAVVGIGKPGQALDAVKGSSILDLDEGNRSRRTVGMRLFLKPE